MDAAGARPRVRLDRAAMALVVVVAVAVRVYPWLHPHAVTGLLEYDDGVYYAASKALVHGLVPYRDFVVVHPPLMSLLLTPAAAVGAVAGDPAGMAVARVAVVLVAVGNVLLVRRIALLAWGPRATWAAVVAALGYAVYPDAVTAEHTVLLEPVMTLLSLSAVAIVVGDRPRTLRRFLAVGALLGAALTVKLFAAVYVLSVLVWVALVVGRRAALLVGAGVAAATAVVTVPFIALAPHAFWTDVVASQLSRPADASVSVAERVADLTGFDALPDLVAVTLAAVVIAAMVWRARPLRQVDRLIVATLVIAVVMFVRGPSYFTHYGDVVAPLLALVIARLVVGLPGVRLTASALLALVVGTIAVFCVGTADTIDLWSAQPDFGALGLTIPAGACVFTDEASLAIAAGVFRLPTPSCPGWIDGRGAALAELTHQSVTAGYLPGRIPVDRRWQSALAVQVDHADDLLLRSAPDAEAGWPAAVRRYVAAHFTLTWSSPHTRAHAELWRRVSP